MKNIGLLILLKLAGCAQLFMAIGSLWLPRWLNWGQSLAKMPVLLRQMFWVYSGYILMANIALGLVSILYPSDVLNNHVLGVAFLIYASLYWLIRVLIQFFYFDKTTAPKGTFYRYGEIALDANFIFLALVYSFALAAHYF